MLRDGFKKNLRIQLDENPAIIGLENFKRGLEKDFYSSVQVRRCLHNGCTGNLIIEMRCPLTLTELLFHLRQGNLGEAHNLDTPAAQGNSLGKRMWELEQQNNQEIEIEELVFLLNNATLVIKRIFSHSVERKLTEILNALESHYNHFAGSRKGAPYEIYIPVLEENLTTIEPGADTFADIFREAYLRYWGLYFDSEEDAVIYDLSRRSFISGDLHMLNH